LDELQCSDLVFVLDYALQSASDPLGNPPPPSGGTVSIPQEDIYTCAQILAVESSAEPGTPPDEEAALIGEGTGNDYLIVEIDGAPLPADRIPLPIERSLETKLGDQALLIGHPRHIPAKGEVQTITYHDGARVHAPFNTIGGSSGSPMVNLSTGKLVGVAVTGSALGYEPSSTQGCEGLWDPCFGCAGTTGAQATIALATLIPPIGLQVASGVVVDHYGPPTIPDDFPGQAVDISVPHGSQTVNWSVSQDGDTFELVEVWEGPTSGTLAGGASDTLTVGPLADYLQTPGTYQATMSFYDSTYSTRTPVLHRVHVGQDGFTATPEEPLDGPDGLGVPHGTTQSYGLVNRWIVPQQLSVFAYDPDDPQQQSWPSWLRLNGGILPLQLTLPAPGEGKAPSAGLVVNGTDLAPGTYQGRIVISADDSGYPPFEEEREVYFDHCREVFADTTLPMEFTIPANDERDFSITVVPTGGTTVADIDLIADLGPQFVGNDRPIEVYLKSPSSPTFVLLKAEHDTGQNVYDDETNPPAADEMTSFDGDSSPGTWQLKLINRMAMPWTFTFYRYQIRLHHEGAAPCVTGS
jgi:hypothetical protein